MTEGAAGSEDDVIMISGEGMNAQDEQADVETSLLSAIGKIKRPSGQDLLE